MKRTLYVHRSPSDRVVGHGVSQDPSFCVRCEVPHIGRRRYTAAWFDMLKKRVVMAGLGALCCLGACATNAGAADFVARRHSLTLGGAFETPAAYNASFGFDDWKEPARYLDLAVAAPGPLERRLHAAGLKTMLYVDPNFCSGSREPGRNPYPRPTSGCRPRP